MRYLMMIKATRDYEAGLPPSPKLMAGMAALTEDMIKAGVLLASDGLKPSSHGTRIAYSNGQRIVTDGPFAETKELIGGFAIVAVNSKAEALSLADRLLEVHRAADVSEFELEMRPLFEPEDFAPR